jgi:monoamine oxidase
MTKSWTRERWSLGNWCAYVESGKDRPERLARLDEVPANFRDEVAAHVRCYFNVKAAKGRVG